MRNNYKYFLRIILLQLFQATHVRINRLVCVRLETGILAFNVWRTVVVTVDAIFATMGSVFVGVRYETPLPTGRIQLMTSTQKVSTYHQ